MISFTRASSEYFQTIDTDTCTVRIKMETCNLEYRVFKLEALVSLHRPDFSVTMKRRFSPLSKEHYYEIW